MYMYDEGGRIKIILCCLTVLDYEVTCRQIECTDTDSSGSIRVSEILPFREVCICDHTKLV